MNQQLTTLENIFGPVISCYTRKQAIEDGVLIDVTESAKEVGLKHHTVITDAVHREYMKVPTDLEGMEDESGRLWDIVWMLFVAIRQGQLKQTQGYFEVLVSKSLDSIWLDNERSHAGLQQRLVTLKAVCGPDDEGEPCVTIMMPNED